MDSVPHNGTGNFKIPKDPTSFSDAMSTEHKSEWLKAYGEEIEAKHKHNVWEVVDRKPIEKTNRNIVKSKWVFKFKQPLL